LLATTFTSYYNQASINQKTTSRQKTFYDHSNQ
jgi:hypothetical protein